MAGPMALLATIRTTKKALKRRCRSATLPLNPLPAWAAEIHARAAKKTYPFEPRSSSKKDEWYFDGTRYRHRDSSFYSDDDLTSSPTPSQTCNPTSNPIHSPTPNPEPTFWPPTFDFIKGPNRQYPTYHRISPLAPNVHRYTGVVDPILSENRSVAVKRVDIDLIGGRPRWPNEVVVLGRRLRNPRHRNLPHFVGWKMDPSSPTTMLLAMDFVYGGDVEAWCRRRCSEGRVIEGGFVLHFLAEMAEALGFLHEGLERRRHNGKIRGPKNGEWKAVVHGNIRLSNILHNWSWRDGDTPPDVVLADFGAARFVAPHDGREPYEMEADAVFDRPWRDPERVVPATDVYDLGVCVAKLLLCGRDDRGGLRAAHEEAGLRRTALRFEVLERCLSADEGVRPTAGELFKLAPALRKGTIE